MPAKKKGSGLVLYNLLKKEIASLNSTRKHPLTGDQEKKFLKEVVFPLYQGTPKSKIRKTEIRETISKKISMFYRSEKNAGKITYQSVVREAIEINENLPSDKQLSYREVLKFVSEKVYPSYKGKSWRSVGKNKLRKFIEEKLQREPKHLSNNILDISDEDLNEEVPYFEIDIWLEALKVNMPTIYVQVNAGATSFGKTEIFKLDNYNYVTSGVSDITNKINKWLRTLRGRQSRGVYPAYFGEIQLRPGKKNNGDPNSYYLEMILVIKGVPAEEKPALKIPRDQKKRRPRKKKNVKQRIKKTIEKLAPNKSKVKGIRKRVAREIIESKIILKNKILPQSVRKEFAKKAFDTTKKRLDDFLKDGVLNQRQYNDLINQIKRAYKP